jgi:sugar phosphate isomerase/epimerase
VNRTYYYSAFHWTDGPVTTLDRATALRSTGIDAIELGSRTTYEAGVEAVVKGLGGDVLLHNYFPAPRESFVFNLASADDTIRSRSLQLAATAIELSAAIGAPCYGVHAGFVTDPDGFDGISFTFPSAGGPRDRDSAYRRFLGSIAELEKAARVAGIRLLVENNVCPPRLVGRLLLQTADEFGRLFEDLASHEAIGILLDTGHLNVTAKTFRTDPLEFAERHAGRIWGLHLHDNDGDDDDHGPVRPSGPALAIARKCEKARWITVEAKCGTLDRIKEQLALTRSALSSMGATT